MIIGKKYTFESAHMIAGHATCGRIHGHSWTLVVQVEGDLDDSGMLMDFHDLNDVVRGILKEFDHRVINEVVSDVYPVTWARIQDNRPITAETLIQLFWFLIEQALRNWEIKLSSLQLQEGIDGGWAKLERKL